MHAVWIKAKQKKRARPVVFVHIPKCGGNYVKNILQKTPIRYLGHRRPQTTHNLCFAIIRHPVDRFQSLLNFRLSENKPRGDWPLSLGYLYSEKDGSKTSLDSIVSKMTEKDMTRFAPFRSLVYWSKNIDVFITIDQLQSFLEFLGHSYEPSKFEPQNVSRKERGSLNQASRDKIANAYRQDVEFYLKIMKLYSVNI